MTRQITNHQITPFFFNYWLYAYDVCTLPVIHNIGLHTEKHRITHPLSHLRSLKQAYKSLKDGIKYIDKILNHNDLGKKKQQQS
jgi:hypothetical protein